MRMLSTQFAKGLMLVASIFIVAPDATSRVRRPASAPVWSEARWKFAPAASVMAVSEANFAVPAILTVPRFTVMPPSVVLCFAENSWV